jgi:hypothetical protein
MSALQTIKSWKVVAATRFPVSVRRIFGSGSFALVSKCSAPWTVLLYETAEDRQNKYEQWECSKCAALRCGYEHLLINLDS